MRTLRRSTLVIATAAMVVALLLPAAGVAAQDDDQVRVDLDFDNAPLWEIVDHIRTRAGMNVLVDKTVRTQRISLEGLTGLTGPQALELVAEQARISLEHDQDENIWRLSPPRVTFNFAGASLPSVIQAIAMSAGVDIFISPDVEGTITIRLTDKPWRQALEVVARKSGYYVLERSGVYSVVTRDTMIENLEVVVLPLSYARPPHEYRAAIDPDQYATGNQVIPAAAVTPASWPLYQALVRTATPEVGTVSYDRRRNAFVVRDTTQRVAQMRGVLDDMDVPMDMVHVRVRVVQTTNDDLFDFGVNWSDGTGANTTPNITQTFGSVATTLPFSVDGHENFLPSSFFRPFILADAGQPTSGPGGDTTGAIAAGPTGGIAGSAYDFSGTLDFSGAEAALRWLDRQQETEVTQSPSVTTVSGEPATIFIGTEQPYASVEAETDQSGAVAITLEEAADSPAREGFQLLVHPYSVPGSDEVVLQVIPKFDAVALQTFTAPAALTGANALSIQLPQVDTTVVVTQAIVGNGETLVIGGLIDHIREDLNRRLPVLGNAPGGLSWPFRNRRDSTERVATLIFLEVWKVSSEEDAARLVAEAREERARRMAREFDDLRGGLGD